jgi:hypothetical protein
MTFGSICLILSMSYIAYLWIDLNKKFIEEDEFLDFQNPVVFYFNLVMMSLFMIDVAAFLYL